jgi:Fe(3+) dicitrate transport protein
VLRGRGEGHLIVRHNAREYESYGIQFTGELAAQTGTVDHTIGFGARLHKDYVERDQFDDVYNQDATGAIVDQQFQLNNVRRQETQALAVWLKDKIEIGDFSLTPGVRYEYIDAGFDDYAEDKSRVDTRAELAVNRAAIVKSTGSESYSEVIPGLSMNYAWSDSVNLFGGVYKGISIPDPRGKDSGVDVEESIGYELGARYQREGLSAELVGFLTDFDNILNTAAGTGAGGDDLTNGGEAEVFGLEGLVSYDPLVGGDSSLPMYLSATLTKAEFGNTIASSGSDGIFDGAEDGNEIPYIPEVKLAAGIGYSTQTWGANLDATYTSETFGTGSNLDEPTDNARAGEIDDLFLVDLSTHYQLSENLKLIGGVANVFDERGVVSRIPRGPRANQGRTYYVGFETRF